MKRPFVKIKTSSESVYVNIDSITSIEETGTGSAIIITEDRTLYGVTEVDYKPCKSIDDIADKLNSFCEDFQSMEKNVIEVNGNHCENVEDVISEINDTIESY